MDSPTQTLSEYLAGVTYSDIPEDVRRHAKLCILDSIGCIIGGSRLHPGTIITELFTEMGGRPESSILPGNRKLPCIHAAYVNSYVANLLDFDDTTALPPSHPSTTIVPPGLALAEKIRAHGRDVITAVVTAYEGWARIGEAIHWSPERFPKVWGLSVHQIFGAAIVACKLLQFDAEQTANTLGLAGVNAPLPNCRKLGVEIEDRPISWAKNNYGWASMGGLMAAFLTDRGFKGNKHILDGEKGFWIMASSDRCNFETITRNLGTEYFILNCGFKPYASCAMTHTSIDATAAIIKEHPVDPMNIKRIRVEAIAEVAGTFGVSNPISILDAQFSLPHLLALEILGRSASRGLSDDNLTDPAVQAIAEKVTIELSPEFEEIYREKRHKTARVSIEMNDGSVFQDQVDVARWSGIKKPTEEELQEKFTYLTEPILGSDAAKAVIDLIDNLENLENIEILISKLIDSSLSH